MAEISGDYEGGRLKEETLDEKLFERDVAAVEIPPAPLKKGGLEWNFYSERLGGFRLDMTKPHPIEHP
jgi:hypothetical protein